MSVFALVDCNNFFVSCERAFRPELEGRPTIVLSNNDGCVISRSEEAKALGIGMAAPFFEVRAIVVEHKVAAISANHELYVDLSRRVSEVLRRHAPVVESYSIDESFLTFPDARDIEARARALRAEVRQWTGLPVSVGLAPTKALAKLGSDKAKRGDGVLSLLDPGVRGALLDETPVTALWGIAKRSAIRLAPYGVRTAGDLVRANDAVIRSALGIGGLKLAHELRGVSCLELKEAPVQRQSVTVMRSFSEPVRSLAALDAALATFSARAAERLRRHGLRAGELSVHFGRREDDGPVFDVRSVRLSPTNDTPALIKAAKALAEALFVDGTPYKKAGIVLTRLTPADDAQSEFFDDGSTEKSARLSSAVDRINAALGGGVVRYGGETESRGWGSRSENRSPCWTTRWEDLKAVHAAVRPGVANGVARGLAAHDQSRGREQDRPGDA